MLLSGYTLQWIEPIKTYYRDVVGLEINTRQAIDICLKAAETSRLSNVDMRYKNIKLTSLMNKERQTVTLSVETKEKLAKVKKKLGLKGVSDPIFVSMLIQEAGLRYVELNRITQYACSSSHST